MSNLEKAKEIVKEYYENADCGIFNSRNTVGDVMTTIYEDENLTIDICYGYAYFEIFGLSNADFEKLEKYYDSLAESESKIIMKIYVAWLQENDWETESFCIGCYSTKEKAKKAIVEALREEGEAVLTLEIYDAQDKPNYIYGIEEYNLDE